MASYIVLSEEEFPDVEEFFWRSETGLKKPIKAYKELFRGRFMCVRLSSYGPQNQTKRKEKSIIQKVFYGHRLTQINTDENHKRLINFGCSAL